MRRDSGYANRQTEGIDRIRSVHPLVGGAVGLLLLLWAWPNCWPAACRRIVLYYTCIHGMGPSVFLAQAPPRAGPGCMGSCSWEKAILVVFLRRWLDRAASQLHVGLFVSHSGRIRLEKKQTTPPKCRNSRLISQQSIFSGANV